LPVRGPSNRHLLLVSRDTGEELACIVVLAEVGDSSCAIEELEVCAIELAREVLSYAAAERCSRVDRKLKQPHRVITSLHRQLDEVWAFILQAEQTDVAQVRSMSPLAQVLRGIEAESQVDGVGEHHDPLLSGSVPNDFGVSELGGVRRDDGVLSIGFESVSAISAVGDGLLLQTLHTPWVFSERVDCYNTVVLVWEEAGGVVRIDDG
jgi:hypothetical protein